ncbi:hypothetical protein KZ829_21665 [Actinoplanes hulinensis]|uniref:DAGKc domain-containing protein n=1 Tax=Actinoplanes hulinensis TaxID=1144547 RepID=A0ABS7B5M4_9ACTN|nr:diacylglycerol kinase family protein [Actinoplanes hulinensis]MBW6436351.1 hypothetical protein [Actinoplanes hulinensis]
MTVTTTRTNPAPRSAVVVNPAKIDDLAELRRTVDGTPAEAGRPAPRWFETTEDDPGPGQTRAAVESGAQVVFVCGGDGTVMSAVSALVTLRIDGGTPMRRRARSVLIADVGRLQGGLRLLSEAQPDDGVLDVAVPTPNTLRTWIALGRGLIRLCVPEPAGHPDLSVDAGAATDHANGPPESAESRRSA